MDGSIGIMDGGMDMNYKKTYKPAIGYTKLCEIGKSSCKRLEFGMVELNKGDSVTIDTEGKEFAFVFLFGHADVQVGDVSWKNVGGRSNVFEGPAHTVVVPAHQSVTFTGLDHVKIGVCDTPSEKPFEPQWLKPDNVKVMTLGEPPFLRDCHMIVDERCNANYLTVGESFVEPGNWAGFPGHKHDEDHMPAESVAEEIYYFLFDPEQGYALQSLYTADGEIDETYRVKGNDLTEFPRGYHATCGIPGYKTYILWLMAGDVQGIHRVNDPEHEWVIK